MFTVLIQNEKTMNSFYEHLPLFKSFIESGEQENQLEICEWNEAGQTIEEALPDLHRLTDDKGSWRAVIVRYDDGPVMNRYRSASDNPYDFVSGSEAEKQVSTQEIPLIRLTRMLQKPLEYFDENRASYSGIEQVQKYDGILPETITFISVRNVDELQFTPHRMLQLSDPDFVEKNSYPSICRFAVVDRLEQGSFRKIKSDFDFWTSVLMIASNRIDSSLMQAYQLYSISNELDRIKMSQLWNQKKEELARARAQIDHALQNQSIYLESPEGPYPDYMVKMEGLTPSVKPSEVLIPAEKFKSLPEDCSSQVAFWSRESEKISKTLKLGWNGVPELVQKSMNASQRRSGYQVEEVDVLSPFQQDRLTEELDELYLKILDEQSTLPDGIYQPDKDLQKLDQQVKSALKNRLIRPVIYKWVAFISLFLVSGMLPAWVAEVRGLRQGFPAVLAVSVLLIVLPVAAVQAEVRKEKKEISRKIASWNSAASSHQDKLQEYMDKYTKYLSDTVSYRRGKSYLELSAAKSLRNRKDQRKLEEIRFDLDRFSRQLDRWAKAMDLSEDIVSDDASDDFMIRDLKNPDEVEKLFLFEPDLMRKCEINETGNRIIAPFSFIQRLVIKAISRGKQK